MHKDNVYYWVMQRSKGALLAHGPWKTDIARDNYYYKVYGGDVHRFNGFSRAPEEAIEEFQREEVKNL